MELKKELKDFSQWFCEKQGELITQARSKGEKLGLSQDEVKKVLSLSFKILGDKSHRNLLEKTLSV